MGGHLVGCGEVVRRSAGRLACHVPIREELPCRADSYHGATVQDARLVLAKSPEPSIHVRPGRGELAVTTGIEAFT